MIWMGREKNIVELGKMATFFTWLAAYPFILMIALSENSLIPWITFFWALSIIIIGKATEQI